MESIIEKVKTHCVELLTHSRCSVLPFHGVQHTLEVFQKCKIIGKDEGLKADELEIVMIAALFHDTGVSTAYVGHEDLSSINAIMFLDSIQYPENRIASVVGCIKATKMPQLPENLMEQVICDADLFHLGSSNFRIKNELLRIEWQIYLNLTFTDEEWTDLNINFLASHHYHTHYGKNILEKKKRDNLKCMEGQTV